MARHARRLITWIGGIALALALLHEHGGDAKLLAGGQSLVPMMAMRLARPAVLVDINRLVELKQIDMPAAGDNAAIRMGAAGVSISNGVTATGGRTPST